MDTPTQAVLGAAIGQALFGHQLGRRAAWWGALGGLIPDLDMLASATMGAFGEFLYHRGPTHSLWFGPVVGTVLGLIVWRLYRREAVLSSWIGLFVIAMVTHPLLDAFTTYGTQLLWPFSHHRFAWNGVAIIDPAYTIPLALALVIGSRTRARPWVGRWAATFALVLTTAYLLLGYSLNQRAESEVKRQLAAEGVIDAEVHCYPTLFQVFLRRAVVKTPDEMRVGMFTFLKPETVKWRRLKPPAHPLVTEMNRTEMGQVFEWFAMGQTFPAVHIVRDGHVVEIDDLRYGFGSAAGAGKGIWGIRGRFDGQGRLVGDVERFRRPLPASVGVLFGELWDSLVGNG